MVTTKALLPVIELDDFPNAVVDVFIELDQTDAGTRCAGICAAAIALADAGVMMKDLVASVSVGVVDNAIVADLNYDEEAYDKGDVADIPVAVIPSTGQVTLLQMDGIVTPAQIKEALQLAVKKCDDINKIQKAALYEKYKVGGDTHA